MKRNISINIRGLIFYIEEDCYDLLKNYLEAINQYFSKYEDSREIIEDIEGRIAEIFYGKLNKEKEVIVLVDVEEMISTMGSIEDFEATEKDPAYQMTFGEDEETKDDNATFEGLEIPTEDDFNSGSGAIVKPVSRVKRAEQEFIEQEISEEDKSYKQEPIYASASSASSYFKEIATEEEYNYKKLYRDTRRNLIGGVASGLGHYFGIEAIWIRLGFLAFFFGFLIIPPATVGVLLIYIAMWAIVPENDNLEENPNIRKFYRDPEQGVLGGVCRGVAVYFGINEMFVRLFFIGILFLYGTGVMAYIILWWVIPKAESLTDRLQMEGEPVTLSSIKERLHQNINLSEEEKSTFHKVFLFPFQILALVISRITAIVRPFINFIAESVRIIGGVSLLLTSITLVTALTISLVMLLGWGPEQAINIDGIPPELFKNSFKFTPYMLTSFYVTAFIPAVYIGLFGVMMLRRQVMLNNVYGWSILGLWFLAAINTGVSVGMIMKDFSSRSDFSQDIGMLTYGDKTFTLRVNEESVGFIDPNIHLRGHDGTQIELVKKFQSNGRDRRDAIQNAKMINYNIERDDYSFFFDRSASLKKGAKFRNQDISVAVNIPIGKEFIIDKSLLSILSTHTLTHPNHNGYSYEDLRGNNTWKFESENKITCLSCTEKTENGQATTILPFTDNAKVVYNQAFENVEVSGAIKVIFENGKSHQVLVDKKHSKYIKTRKNGNKLEISPKRGIYSKKVIIKVISPNFEGINLMGASVGQLLGVNQESLEVELNGASSLELSGKVEEIELDLTGSSSLLGKNLICQEVEIDGSGASYANLIVDKELKADLSGASTLRYSGKVKDIDVDTSGGSRIMIQESRSVPSLK